MAYTANLNTSIEKVRGLLTAMQLDKRIRIAFDEWNLRGWYHPNVHTIRQGVTKEEYLYPRDENDDNTKYTMADAVFTACFLNTCNRNCDIVGMANFAPIVNTRGCIYTYPKGIVLRSTYHVFDLYVNYLGDIVLDSFSPKPPLMTVKNKAGKEVTVEQLDIVATSFSDKEGYAIAAVNKSADEEVKFSLDLCGEGEVVRYYISGNSTESYNDVDHTEVTIRREELGVFKRGMEITAEPHSVNIIQIGAANN